MSAVDALQTALAGEHAAVYVYGTLGGRDLAVDGTRPVRRRPRPTPRTGRRRDELVR